MRNPFFPYLLKKKKKKESKEKQEKKVGIILILVQEPPTWLYCFLWSPEETKTENKRAFIITQNKTSHPSLKINVNVRNQQITMEMWEMNIALCWSLTNILNIHDNLNITIELNPEHSVFLYDTCVSYLCFTELCLIPDCGIKYWPPSQQCSFVPQEPFLYCHQRPDSWRDQIHARCPEHDGHHWA